MGDLVGQEFGGSSDVLPSSGSQAPEGIIPAVLSKPILVGIKSKETPTPVGSERPVSRQQKLPRRRSLPCLMGVAIIGVLLLTASSLWLLHPPSLFGWLTSTPTDSSRAFTTPDGQLIGISDGLVAFDTDRADGNLKKQAANALREGHLQAACGYWQWGRGEDGTDAELAIYEADHKCPSPSQDNRCPSASPAPHITFVVVTTLSGDPYAVNVGRDILQGAYVAQYENNCNTGLPNGVQVRLLIANLSSSPQNALSIAQQIVQARQKDPTIAGVMGWPFASDEVLQAIYYLNIHGIPMVSPTPVSDTLNAATLPYFFSVAPSLDSEAKAGAEYAEQAWQARKVLLLSDPNDAYSTNLAEDFKHYFHPDIDDRPSYSVGDPSSFSEDVHAAIIANFDLIYFAGYPADARALLQEVHSSGSTIHVLGGDVLYQFIYSSAENRPDFNSLSFSAFAYPDEWGYVGRQQPGFFTDFKEQFDPGGRHIGNPYRYGRSDNDTMLAYDAMQALLEASRNTLASGKQHVTSSEVQQALTQMNAAHPLLGISGQIAFGPGGVPQDKAVAILSVAPPGIQWVKIQEGCYWLTKCS